MDQKTDLQGYDLFFNVFKPGVKVEEAKVFYDGWAEKYESDAEERGYVAVEETVKILAETMDVKGMGKDVHILDLGAGTGKVGQALKDQGYNNVDALDMSPEMLKVAEKKGVYKKLYCEQLGAGPLPIEDDNYDVVGGVACYGLGHIQEDALYEMIRITKPGGLIVISSDEKRFDNKTCKIGLRCSEFEERKILKMVRRENVNFHLHIEVPEARYILTLLYEKL